MSLIRRFFSVAVMIAALTITLAAQQPVGGNNKKQLENGEKCEEATGCKCGDKDAAKGCSCGLSGGTSTVSCPLGGGGDGPSPLSSGLMIFVGGLIGSGLTYLVMRRRVPQT